MDRLFKSILDINEIKSKLDDDFTDRLSRQRTVIVMIVITFILAAKQFVGDPLTCWCPAYFTKSHIDYTNLICWVSPTYNIPVTEPVPRPDLNQSNGKHMVAYYRWMPIMLLIQACFSYMPCVVWRFLNKRSGININDIMEATRPGPKESTVMVREPGIQFMATRVQKYLLAQRNNRKGTCASAMHTISMYCCMIGGRQYGNYLTTCFVFTKLLYIGNALGQLFMLDRFLGIDYHFYGIHMAMKFFKGEENWTATDRFPRVTLCEFEIRQIGERIHKHVVQCVLAINLFNEKIFLFIWFWFVYVAFATMLTTCKWIGTCMYWPVQTRFVWSQLKAADSELQKDCVKLETFTKEYLRRDGLFLIRLMNMNLGESISSEVLYKLWCQYKPDKTSNLLERSNYNANLRRRYDKQTSQKKFDVV